MRVTGNFLAIAAVGAGVLLTAGCGSPFLPETGVPQREQSFRRTPKGVVQQLVYAYENRRLDLFQDLLYSKSDFRFYVEPDPVILAGFHSINTGQTEDVCLRHSFILDGKYTFLTYNQEIDIHRNLFNEAEQISFYDQALNVDTVQYFLSIDSVDATLLPDSSGALYAMARTEATRISIKAQRVFNAYHEETHVFPVGRQVFYLKKDDDGLWRILRWFELAGV